MKILSLCFCNNYFKEYKNELIDIKFNKNVFDLDLDIGKEYDLILSAPPCDQFTKANAGHWLSYPEHFIRIAYQCFNISVNSGQKWILENPPGRIEKFIPALKNYRLLTFLDLYSNKEYILYGNVLIMPQQTTRYNKNKIHAWDKNEREKWTAGLIETLKKSLCL